MAALALSGEDREMKVALEGRPLAPWMPSPWAVIVPMMTWMRWSMFAPMCSHMLAVTTFSPVALANLPVSMFMPLNWACEAMRLISLTSWDTSTWICIRSSLE